MNITLMPRVEDISSQYIKGRNVVVIDMLRATSVIVTAINNSAIRVIPVLTVEEALRERDAYSESVLGGEREGLRIEGFDAGNSPLEYTREFISGKTLVMTTSNGTRAIRACNGAKNIFIGAMLNGEAVAKKAAESLGDISIVCSGTLGRFSLDDFLCSGYIIDELLRINKYELDDISFLAHHTFAQNRDKINEFINNANHCRYLKSIGLEKDIDYCCSMSIINKVPVYKDGFIL